MNLLDNRRGQPQPGGGQVLAPVEKAPCARWASSAPACGSIIRDDNGYIGVGV